MSAGCCGCDATSAGLAACHCLKCHLSFADRPMPRRILTLIS